MCMITTYFSKEIIKYDGTQIESLWAARTFGIIGPSIIAFIGPCDIPYENMVDLEDVKTRSKISGNKMLHFIIEHFDRDLEKAFLRQRLLSSIIKEEIEGTSRHIKRINDNLYDEEAKITITIATLTPVSSKIHFAVNISSKGTPIKTKGLDDYKIQSTTFGLKILEKYKNEIEALEKDIAKVRGVK